jgi:hypothetical protein
MALARIFAFLVLGLLVSGCALNENTQDHEAGTAVKNVLEHEYTGDYGTVWDSLHPRHQRLVTREEYEKCRRGIDVEGTIESVLILDVRDEPLVVYGLRPRTASKAVKVRVTTDESEYTASYHVVRVGDRWRWVLADRAARGFARTDCPE